ncbi:hypothetical protein DLAC_05152 [Tieghemostelium lacteum]|uniref:Uncharacterized protein n=1 Tax=Tieghemostelium lacteum TaxID=361077 RepID=A0A151ZIE6_TIELA|nr:hypothetical protein DLAC_05152 [Tieghemostelium lacteum]|eukprot:KYQ93762.1 hypothetical protein DLAC_05152 [Tieghemostelium lacteum]
MMKSVTLLLLVFLVIGSKCSVGNLPVIHTFGGISQLFTIDLNDKTISNQTVNIQPGDVVYTVFNVTEDSVKMLYYNEQLQGHYIADFYFSNGSSANAWSLVPEQIQYFMYVIPLNYYDSQTNSLSMSGLGGEDYATTIATMTWDLTDNSIEYILSNLTVMNSNPPNGCVGPNENEMVTFFFSDDNSLPYLLITDLGSGEIGSYYQIKGINYLNPEQVNTAYTVTAQGQIFLIVPNQIQHGELRLYSIQIPQDINDKNDIYNGGSGSEGPAIEPKLIFVSAPIYNGGMPAILTQDQQNIIFFGSSFDFSLMVYEVYNIASGKTSTVKISSEDATLLLSFDSYFAL